ncbi:MAG: hypothetical protein LUH17_01325 [Acidaminococcaceae bacterium]|nr:hypothetical protein [Acidaminococcaceae bacterium]
MQQNLAGFLRTGPENQDQTLLLLPLSGFLRLIIGFQTIPNSIFTKLADAVDPFFFIHFFSRSAKLPGSDMVIFLIASVVIALTPQSCFIYIVSSLCQKKQPF